MKYGVNWSFRLNQNCKAIILKTLVFNSREEMMDNFPHTWYEKLPFIEKGFYAITKEW